MSEGNTIPAVERRAYAVMGFVALSVFGISPNVNFGSESPEVLMHVTQIASDLKEYRSEFSDYREEMASSMGMLEAKMENMADKAFNDTAAVRNEILQKMDEIKARVSDQDGRIMTIERTGN